MTLRMSGFPNKRITAVHPIDGSIEFDFIDWRWFGVAYAIPDKAQARSTYSGSDAL